MKEYDYHEDFLWVIEDNFCVGQNDIWDEFLEIFPNEAERGLGDEGIFISFQYHRAKQEVSFLVIFDEDCGEKEEKVFHIKEKEEFLAFIREKFSLLEEKRDRDEKKKREIEEEFNE